jgi:hypothetical protein
MNRIRRHRFTLGAASQVGAALRALVLGLALAAFVSVLAVRAAGPTASAASGSSGAPPAATRPPAMAYYYMWFSKSSWTHSKNDLPILGGYDSTDRAVIAQQVAWAKAAGVNVFIASWKNTPSLDLALSELVAECHSQGLKLVLIYEGLDVNRNPIPASTVSADISWFLNRYGSDLTFDVFGKPAVIWSGTWKFSTADVANVRAQVGAPSRVLLLGSETGAASYQARASLFDGDAYYWSSGDPMTTPGYQNRLDALGRAVHAGGGLWLAPVTAGFDGRLNGGSTVVDRRNGGTLTQAWNDALATKPDGMAIISWNEYTESSYIEPSRNYAYRYLQVLSGLDGAPPAAIPTVPARSPDASSPPATASPPTSSPAHSATGPNYGAPLGPPTPWLDTWASVVIGALVLTGLGMLAFTMRKRSADTSHD